MDESDQISVTCRTRRFHINEPKLRALARRICGHLGVPHFQLGIQLVGSAEIRRLNREFRGKDKATDVLSFPQQVWSPPLKVRPRPLAGAGSHRATRQPPEPLGDLAISLPEAERNARRIGQPLDVEACFLMVHGILHLCGHDHEQPEEERRMLAAQRRLMAILAQADRGRPLWSGSVRALAREAR